MNKKCLLFDQVKLRVSVIYRLAFLKHEESKAGFLSLDSCGFADRNVAYRRFRMSAAMGQITE